MFSPNDEGLQYPLTHKEYHGRVVICDSNGYELFTMEVIRNSIEAREWLVEWADKICGGLQSDKKSFTEEVKEINEEKPENEQEETKETLPVVDNKRKTKFTNKVVATIKEMRQGGATIKQIADRVRMSYPTIQKWIKANE